MHFFNHVVQRIQTYHNRFLSSPYLSLQFTPRIQHRLMRGGTGLILGLSKDALSTAHTILGRMDRMWMMPLLRYNHRQCLVNTRKVTNIVSQISKPFSWEWNWNTENQLYNVLLTEVLVRLCYAFRFFQTPPLKFRTQHAPRLCICLRCFNYSGKHNFCHMKSVYRTNKQKSYSKVPRAHTIQKKQ
jgi:hypothetical protein